jgi:hypothetical protein
MKLPEEMQAAMDAAVAAFPGVSVKVELSAYVWQSHGKTAPEAMYRLAVHLPAFDSCGTVAGNFFVESRDAADLVAKAQAHVTTHGLPPDMAAAWALMAKKRAA